MGSYAHTGHCGVTLPARSSGAVVYLLSMLAKRKSLSSAQFASLLLNASQAAFTGISMFFRSHFNVILWIASVFIVREEGAVASIKDINFWIG